MEYYYLYTQDNFNNLDKTKIYSRFLSDDGYAVLQATSELTNYTQSFNNITECMTYITNNQSKCGGLEELDFEMQYIPSIDDI